MTTWSIRLRRELSRRAREYAEDAGIEYYQSLGESPVTLFRPSEDGRSHGNFALASYSAILAKEGWRRRLEKAHPQQAALPLRHRHGARELDSCMSSDALLMNVFTFPGVLSAGLSELLCVPIDAEAVFGFSPGVPLKNGDVDTTEVDMRLGNVHVEAKLTETDFTERPIEHVERYRGLYEVLDRELLPRNANRFGSYQLLRNVLAIWEHPDARFVLFLDGRRPDLLHNWWSVHQAIRAGELRARCSFLTWQEIAERTLPELRTFLESKYGL